MKFSLIVGTYNNFTDLPRLFDSLLMQTYKNFEVIVVDQNKTSIIRDQCRLYENHLDMLYIQVDQPSLSRARNIGVKNASGEILSFPDDDCEYEPETLKKVYDYFLFDKNHSILAVSTREKETNELLSYTPVSKRRKIRKHNVFFLVTSIGLFVKKNNVYFDVNFGAGEMYNSCEEFDYVFQLLDAGFTGEYVPSISVFHPQLLASNPDYFLKIHENAKGHGAFFKKNVAQNPLSFAFIFYFFVFFVKPLIGALYYLFRLDKVGFSRQEKYFLGRLYGYVAYKKKEANFSNSLSNK